MTYSFRILPLIGCAVLLAGCACAGHTDSVEVRVFDHPHPYLAKEAAPSFRAGDRMVLNGPLFDRHGDPVGGWVTEGTDGTLLTKDPVAVTPGDGNFAWRNALFGQTRDGRFFLTETDAGAACTGDNPPRDAVVFAIQNGPALVENGVNLHDPASSRTAARTGLGATADGRLLVAYSPHPITIYVLAQTLIDHGAVDAIYLDGGDVGWIDNFGAHGDLPDDATYLHIR